MSALQENGAHVSNSSSVSGSSGATPASTTTTATSPAEMSPDAVQDENLVCRWSNCSDRFATPEILYDHICEKHVGRKSTNNLNLTCQWATCRTTTVKRDHITSHIRVHVPLKPHKCDFCGKSFKRPQDLKKHVKTHADDSAIMNRSQQELNNGGMSTSYRPSPKGPPSYYDHTGQVRPNPAVFAEQGHQNGFHSYYNQAPSAHPSHHHPHQSPMFSNYQTLRTGTESMYHQVSHPTFLDGRHKRNFEDIDNFFGNVKRRAIDPSSYRAIGTSLMPLHGSFSSGGGLALDYPSHPGPQPQPQQQAQLYTANNSYGPLHQHYYLPPMSNARTKSDLMQIDQALESMQSTIYENTGTSPPHSHFQALDIRGHSPAFVRAGSDPYSTMAGGTIPSPISDVASHSSTPAVTPPSSSMSHTSGHSPASTSGLSPISRHSSTSISYPILPVIAHQGQYGLGSNFNAAERRLSGGLLQSANSLHHPANKSSPATPCHNEDSDSRASTPRASETTITVSSPSESSDSGEGQHGPETYEEWVQHMRVIEALRQYVRERLERGYFEDDCRQEKPRLDVSRIDPMVLESEAKREEKPKNLYPSLPDLAT